MIALIDYGAGNLRSVQNALERLDVRYRIVTAPPDLDGVQGIIFPGVGAAAPAMAALQDRQLEEPIKSSIRHGMPFLGICLGLEVLFERSAEDGAICLGVLEGTVERLKTAEKLPHIGWNSLERVRPHPVLRETEGKAFYFVHSYVVVPRDPGVIAAETTYGVPFTSVVDRDHLVGVQFHPERSGQLGLRLLDNFVRFARVAEAA